MRRCLPLLTPVFASALLLSCGEQPAQFEPTSSPLASRTSNNPDGPGAFVVVIPEASFVDADPDPAPGLVVLAGATYAEHLHFCETGEPPFPMDRLLVFRPDGSIKTRVKGAKVPLLVWQTTLPFIDPLAEICSEAFLALPRLDGTGQFLDRDNDLLVSGNRANAFGYRIVGQVSSEAGDLFHFLGKSRGLILKNGEFRSTRDFQLKPIGQ